MKALEEKKKRTLLFHWKYTLIHPKVVRKADIQCKFRLIRAALGVIRYKQKHKHWPKNLKACTPNFLLELPRNPYSPTDFIRFTPHPPRVWRAVNGGHPEQHINDSRDSDRLSISLQGGYGQQDQVLFLDKPIFRLGHLTAHAEPIKSAEFAGFDLGDADPVIRRAAARDLGKYGEEAWYNRKSIFKLIHDPTPEFRAWASYLLGTMNHPEPSVFKALARLEQDEEASVRLLARESIRWLHTTKNASD